MSTYKNVNGDFILSTTNVEDQIIATAANIVLNGNVGVAKTVMSEIVPDRFTARAFGDVDADNIIATFELTGGGNSNGTMGFSAFVKCCHGGKRRPGRFRGRFSQSRSRARQGHRSHERKEPGILILG